MDPESDVWELYNLEEDWTQANDLAADLPEKVAHMKNLFLVESTRNKKPADRRACGRWSCTPKTCR